MTLVFRSWRERVEHDAAGMCVAETLVLVLRCEREDKHTKEPGARL